MALWLLLHAFAIALAMKPVHAGGLFGDLVASEAANTDDNASPRAPRSRAGREKALADQLISLCSEPDSCMQAVTNDSGYFQFDDVPAGTYTLETLGPDGSVVSGSVDVGADSMQGVKIVTPSAASKR
ncbi:prealbumin-like fold domain-containing protein [Aurantimonas litoralis]|nr:prealbumin-like fold domain-containing protein [Aurantimonas litoralis]